MHSLPTIISREDLFIFWREEVGPGVEDILEQRGEVVGHVTRHVQANDIRVLERLAEDDA